MTVNQLLDTLYYFDIQLFLDNGNITIKYKKDKLNNIEIKKIKQQIKENKKDLIQRLEENKKAKEKKFLIYGDGDLYEYRYGFNSFLFIERLDNGLTYAYRSSYKVGDNQSYKTIILGKNVPFDKAFEKAAGFIDWLNKRNRRW
ncbi:hypothetical protein QA612_09815 [Evansella sp. AB-P1]|uniref:hypothetical protein n=1 Tax=Evansella sp. AB-P1 TaxID=3037653 RepID=UPI00241FC22B|nr:hypothetical protein [Evansella sp. AB-P1]MDG5787796.1 hypothetical protein [Evansella sp. AB-P1]